MCRAAQVTLTGTPSASTQTIQATNGQTFHFRLKAVNAAGRSAFSNEATKVASFPTPPGPPTNFRIDFVAALREDGTVSLAMVLRDFGPDTIYIGG